MKIRINGLVAASLLVIAAGCTQSTTSDTLSPEMLASYQSSLALAAEPDQAVSVLEARELLGGGASVAADDDAAHEHADDGHQQDTDGADHAEHEEGHADSLPADLDGHEHGTDGNEHAEHEHDGHEHEGHAHDDRAHEEHGHSHDGEGHPIVIVGKIGGAAGADGTLSDFPWEKGRATFIISDPSFEPAHEHDHGHEHGDEHSHDDHECHFCQAQAIDAQAWVRFLGEDNKPLAVDARKLFDVKEGDIVVVKGHAKLSAGLLVVDAQGMYVRR